VLKKQGGRGNAPPTSGTKPAIAVVFVMPPAPSDIALAKRK
jgi:hypothetical protein